MYLTPCPFTSPIPTLTLYTPHPHPTHSLLPLPSAPAIVDPGENTTTDVPEDGLRYFQTECAAFSDMVLVELTDLVGTNFLFCSASEPNPGPLTDNTASNTTVGVQIRTCIVHLQDPASRVIILCFNSMTFDQSGSSN